MWEEDRVRHVSVKHCLIVSNSGWTWQPYALFTVLYTWMDQWPSGTRTQCNKTQEQHCAKTSLISLSLHNDNNQHKSKCSLCTHLSHRQNLDMEEPQFDGVRLGAWTCELWKFGSLWHHVLKKEMGVRECGMLQPLAPGAMCGETQKAWPSASTNCISPASPPLREHPSPSPGWHSVYSHIHLSCPQSAAWIEMLWPWWMAFLITLKNKKESSTELEVMFKFFVCFLFDFLVSLLRLIISSEDAPSVGFF